MANLADEIRHNPAAGARRLVAEYRDRLYQVAYRLYLNAADAEDLTFRTFHQAIERIGSYRPAYRINGAPADRYGHIGFRVACTAGLQ